MKKIIPIVIIILTIGWGFSITACSNNKQEEQKDTISSNKKDSVIEFMCKEFENDVLTPEEIALWDSLNANGGALYVRGAERHLDTIVNHIRLIFIPEP